MMGTRGNTFYGLEIEGHRVPSGIRARKIETKNHFKENLRKLRQQQRDNKLQRIESRQPVRALWKSPKYEQVESKLKAQLESMFGTSQIDSNRSYLRGHSRTGFRSASARGVSPLSFNTRSIPGSRASTAREGNNVDYIKLNGCAIKHYALKKSSSLSNLDTIKQNSTHHSPGQIPQYLIDRKNEWMREEEERQKKLKEASIPPGHRLMTEKERCETLEKAKQKYKELYKQFGGLPLRNDTVRLRALKDELEMKLSDIEQTIKSLSKPKVFIDLHS